jgi:type I restriction enzyme S subunit
MGKKVQLRTLLDCCDLITDGAHKSPKTYDKGLPYVTVRDVNDDGDIDTIGCKKINKIDFDLLAKGNCQPVKGDILFSKDGTVGKVALVDVQEPFVVLSSLAILRPNKIILNSNYFKYMMLSPNIQDEAIGLKTGAAIKRIVLKTINLIRIPLPSLPEQQRIVTKLDGLFAKINQAIGLLEDNIEHTQTLMGSVLDEEFGKLKEFEILTIDEAKESNVIGLVRSSKIQNENKEFDYLKMNNITRNGDLDLTNIVCVDATEEEFKKYSLKKGDFLFNTRNSIELVGKTAVYDLDNPILFNNNIMRIRFKEVVNPYFINFQFFSNKTKVGLEKIKSGTTSVAAIYYKTFKNLELKIPSIKIQNKLVLKLSEFSNKLNQTAKYQTQKLNHLKALKSSLLDQAFKGEL